MEKGKERKKKKKHNLFIFPSLTLNTANTIENDN